jgi:sugar phosphate isomerase/epimerase
MKRRTFLHTAALATLASQVDALRAATAGMQVKIGACDWTMKLAAQPAALDLAKRIGLDGVQVDFGSTPDAEGWLPLFDEKLQDTYLAKSAELGIAVPSLALAVLNGVPLKSDPEAEKWVLASPKVAQRLKSSCVLLAFFGKGSLAGDEPGIEKVTGILKKLAPLAEEAGLIYGIESTLKVPALETILDKVASPSIQVWYDVANMDKEGEDYGEAIRRLGKERICEFHAKDFEGLYGQGNIDFAKMRDAMRDIGWHDAWVHIEGTQLPNGVEEDVRYDAEYLRGVFGG